MDTGSFQTAIFLSLLSLFKRMMYFFLNVNIYNIPQIIIT